MEVNFDDMSSEQRIVFLVNGLSNLLWQISVEARTVLRQDGFSPDKTKEYRLLALIEGQTLGQHDTSGAMDYLDHLRATLEDEGMYHSEEEDEEEFEEDESDELTEVEA